MLKRVLLSFVLIIFAAGSAVLPAAEAYSSSQAEKVIKTGNRYLGTPYKFGAKYGQTKTFDCSSFVKTVYAKNGITLPRTSRDQAKRGNTVSRSNLKKGDLVFFKSAGSSSKRITHVAIYAGSNKLLHTYGAGGVKYTSFSQHWKNRYVVAKRVL